MFRLSEREIFKADKVKTKTRLADRDTLTARTVPNRKNCYDGDGGRRGLRLLEEQKDKVKKGTILSSDFKYNNIYTPIVETQGIHNNHLKHVED